jgi:hypothetical protein
MQEDDAFKQLLDNYLQNSSIAILRGYPLYEVTDGISKAYIRIIDPFVTAEINNVITVREATPRKVMEIVKRELSKDRLLKTDEKDPERFSKVLLNCAQQMNILLNNPMGILKIKILLAIVRYSYITLKIRIDEMEMFNKAINLGLLDCEMFPGRGPSDSIELRLSKGETGRYALVRFKSYKLITK